MTYDELKSTAEVFLPIDAQIYANLMSIITKCKALGVSATECMLMVNCVLNAPKDKEVYKRDKVTKNRIIEGGFYIACREHSKLKN